MTRTAVGIGGGAILAFGLFLFIIPLNSLGTATDIHESCNSALGTIGKMFSSQISQQCQQIEYVAFGSYGLMGVGIALVITGAVMKK